MAKKSGLDQRFYIQGNDLSGDISALNGVSSPRGVIDVPNLAKSAMERLYGLSDGQMEINSWFNPAAGQAHPVLSALPTTDVIALWALGAAVGDVAAAIVAKQINYDPDRAADGAFAFTTEVLSNTGVPLEWMNMLTAFLDTQASSGTTASRNDLAGTSNGLAAVLQVNEIDSGTPTVTIEDSANDSSWATLVAFSAVANGAEPTAERVTVAGTVDQYLRLNISGTFVNLDYAVATRRGESVDSEAYV